MERLSRRQSICLLLTRSVCLRPASRDRSTHRILHAFTTVNIALSFGLQQSQILHNYLENFKKIRSTALYAAETWPLRKVDIQRLESFEMWIWRRLMKISWTEHRSNQEVLDMVDENRSLMNTIRQRQS